MDNLIVKTTNKEEAISQIDGDDIVRLNYEDKIIEKII